MNPILNIIQAFQNPQALIQNMMQNQQIMNSPLGNAVNAASKGDQKTLEEIARNMSKEKGINPDDAFNQVKQMMNGNMPNKTFDAIVDFVTGIFDTVVPKVNYSPSAGVEQWRQLAAYALKLTNQYSDANLNLLLYQMQTESGGNPNAINDWDINAKNGTPSKGLMQVIDPTFERWAMDGYDTSIWDPLSNMIAAIRYTVNCYGSLANGWKGHGYASGIGKINLSDLIPAYEVGGFPEDGLFFANHDELVGRFSNGKTAVANNPDIQKGIEEAAYRGFVRASAENTRETSLLEELIDAVREGKQIVVDGRELVSAYDRRKNRNGFSFT